MKAIPRPRLIRRASIQPTAGLSVPTMRSATTSTRNTGQSRISSHSPATTRINRMIVAGGTRGAPFAPWPSAGHARAAAGSWRPAWWRPPRRPPHPWVHLSGSRSGPRRHDPSVLGRPNAPTWMERLGDRSGHVERASSRNHHRPPGPPSRKFDDLLQFADLLLDLASHLLASSVGFQVRVVRQVTHLLLDLCPSPREPCPRFRSSCLASC